MNTTKSKIISFIRFYKVKLQNVNRISEQNLEGLASEATRLKEIVEKEVEFIKNGIE